MRPSAPRLAAALLSCFLLGKLLGCENTDFTARSSEDSGTAGSAGTGGTGASGGVGGGGTAGTSSVSDGAIDTGSDVAQPPAFPKTPVLDDFEMGGLRDGWHGGWEDFEVRSNTVENVSSSCGPMYFGPARGPTQEAFVTLAHFASADREAFVVLKAQNEMPCEQIEVMYAPVAGAVVVSTCVDGTWTTHKSQRALFAAGDQLGARAFPSGKVEVYKNGVLVTSVVIPDFPYNDQGGFVGIGCWPDDGTMGFDDFGGGTAPEAI